MARSVPRVTLGGSAKAFGKAAGTSNLVCAVIQPGKLSSSQGTHGGDNVAVQLAG